MTAERLARLPPETAKAAAAAAGVPDYMADLNVFRVLLHNPPVAAGLNGLLDTLLWKGRLDVRMRELVIMRIGWVTGSVYEWTQHWRVARSLGVPEADLIGVRDWAGHDGFGEAERSALRAVDEILSTGALSADTWSACQGHLDDATLVELVAVVGNWQLFSVLLRSLDVPLEDGVDPWPPDGTVPPQR